MGPILSAIIQTAGGAAVKEAISASIKRLMKDSGSKVTPTQQGQIEKEVESLIKMASFEDVKQFDPKYDLITRGIKKAPAKKAVAKKAAPAKKVAKKAIAKRTLKKSIRR